jgi:hypothetical protein
MKGKFWLAALVVGVLGATPVLADGEFYVIAGGGGAALGTKISSLPYTIDSPGFYYVTQNLTGQTGITVNADNVTIDLMGFSLTGPNQTDIDGIKANSRNNVEVRNGTLIGWYYGFRDKAGYASNYRAFNLRIIGVAGVAFGAPASGSTGHIVKGCTISGSPSSGAYGIGCSGVISDNVVSNCKYGISCASNAIKSISVISNNVVNNCSDTGINIIADTVVGNSVLCNAGQIGIFSSAPDSSGNFKTLLANNTVSGTGTHFATFTDNTVRGTNAGL